MSDKTFNPQSTDAMFATILEKLNRIEEQTIKTNGRVTALERDKWYTRGVTATVAVIAGGVWEWLRSR